MRKTFRRGIWIAAGLAGAAVLLVGGALVFASFYDWERAKPWLAEKVSLATEREFAINGKLALDWQRPKQVQGGWRKWAPWPHLRANDVMLGNPEWAKASPHMARAQQVDFTINPFKLFARTVSVEELVLTEPDLVLEQDKGDRNNWTFPKKAEKKKSAWTFALGDMGISRGNVRYVDPGKGADATLRLDTQDDGSVLWKLGGRFNDEKLSGGGTAGSLMMLRGTDVRYPVDAVVKVGGTTITAKGSVTDPASPSALDIKLKILGASMADLFPLSGVLLPETPKFSTEGRVVGRLTRGSMRLRYEKFTGQVGSSDIGGTLDYVQRSPRPLLQGEVVSNKLVFSDLGALIGSDGGKQKDREIKQPPDKALPVSPFKTERWDKMDVRVRFTGKEIIRAESLPIDNLDANVHMQNGVLTLAPLAFGIAGGRLSSEIHIDGKTNPANARMTLSARGLRLDRLFPKAESMRASIGALNGDAKFSANGNSIAALLGSVDGELKALIDRGSVSKFILEAAGLNVGSALLAKMFGDRQVPLRCMAADFAADKGVLRTRTFVIDTEDAAIRVDGSVDFSREQLDFTINPDSKGPRILSLRSPLYVKGSFKQPDVGIDKKVLALKGGAAILLGTAAAPFAALLALINPGPGPGQDSPCAELLAEAQKKPVAPPPEKTAKRKESAEP